MTSDELCACLVDRPCDACKFHTDLGCSKWSCVFEDKIEEAEHHKLNIADYIHDQYPDVWKHAEKELEVPFAERVGKWITKPNIYGVVYCSECDFELHINNTNYCPNCGARMKGEEE